MIEKPAQQTGINGRPCSKPRKESLTPGPRPDTSSKEMTLLLEKKKENGLGQRAHWRRGACGYWPCMMGSARPADGMAGEEEEEEEAARA